MTNRKLSKRAGFTLVEVLVTTVLISIAIVGAFGAIRNLERSQSKANTAELLQRLAAEKLNDVEILATPSTNGDSGDFSDRGYPNITWSLDDEPSTATNVDQITVTVTEGKDSQELTTMLYIPPTTGTTTTTGTASGGGTTP